MSKPVAEFWYTLETHESRVTCFRESHVDPYAVGETWLVSGSEMDVAVDGGSGIVPAGPLVEAFADKPVLCVALTCSYDHAGGWRSFTHRACHRLDVPCLADPVEENAEIHHYLRPPSGERNASRSKI